MKKLEMSRTWFHAQMPFNEDMFYSEKLISPVKKFKDWPKSFKEQNTALLEEEVNENGFRSDNFINDHNGKHLLFAGCSYTWGIGLGIEEVWSKKLYNLISDKNKCSGFFNLGIPGQGMITQIFYIFKYCKIYGNPDSIFFNIPDLGRFYYYNNNDDKLLYDSLYDDSEMVEILNVLAYQYYFMLEQYCLKNNIKLYSFSWCDAEDANKNFMFVLNKTIKPSVLKNFETFNNISIGETLDFVFEYIENNKGKDFLHLSRDKDHLGIAYHEYWSQFIFKKYSLLES
jgi:hypothetical protein